MLGRFLDWLDEAAAGLIRVAYLLAGVTAVAVYFGAGHLPTVVQDALNGALPWVLSFSVETHTYLSARRVRSAWQDMQASAKGSPEHGKARGALKVNLGVLAFLVAFSCWNQLNYLYDTWTPPHTALALPGWLAYVVRALVIPAAFMCAAFLAPLALPIAAQIEQEARATLADVFKIARRQRRKMLQLAEREGRDMTRALVELVTDDELRRVISHAYRAIAVAPAVSAMSTVVTLAPVAPSAPNLSEEAADIASGTSVTLQTALERTGDVSTSTNHTPDRPPTGPGSPAAAPVRTDADTPVRTGDKKVVELPKRKAHSTKRKTAAQARGGRANGKGVRTAEQRRQEATQKRTQRLALVAEWLAEEPQIATRELTRKLQAVEHSRVSESTVNGLRREVEATRTAQAGLLAQ